MNEPEPEKKDDNHRSNNSVLKLNYCKCMCFRFQEIRIHQPTPSPHFFQLIFTDFDFLLQVARVQVHLSYMCKYMRLRPTLFSYTLRDNLLHCKLVSSFTFFVNNKKRIQPRYIFITFWNDITFCVNLTKIYYNTQCYHYL